MSVDLKAYKGSAVAKVFPGYGDKPFEGIVDKVDARDKKTPIHITYDDGDAEWISHQELLQIIQKAPSHAGPSKTTGSGDTTRKRAKGKQGSEQALAATANHSSKKHRSSSNAAAASADPNPATAANTGFDADKAKRSLKDQAQAIPGMTKFTFTARAAQRAAAAGGSPVETSTGGSDSIEQQEATATAADKEAASNKAAAAGGGKGSANKAAPPAGAGAAAASPAPNLPQLLTAIHQTASTIEDQMTQQPPARLLYRGPGATMLPVMSQAVTAAGECHISLYSTGKTGNSTPGRGLQGTQIDYQSEAEAVLNELEKLLDHGASSKGMLLKVKVTLRSMADVLPGFKAAWDAWVDRAAVPVLTLCEGAGPFTTSNITLEAMAYTKSR